MKRPLGFTLLALYLGGLSIAGFLWALVVPGDEFFGRLMPLLRVLAFLYGVFALSSAVGLIRMKHWTRTAIWCWMASCLFIMIIFTVIAPKDLILGGHAGLAGFFVFIAVLFFAIDNYVQKRLERAT